MNKKGRNPYFIGINSAIQAIEHYDNNERSRNPYFIGINSAIHTANCEIPLSDLSQSLFYWN